MGLITAVTAIKSKRLAHGQTQGFFLVLLEGKEIADCGQFWGQLGGGSLCASSSTKEVRLWPNFSQNWKSNDNTSHQEPGHLGLKSSTPTEPKIPLALADAGQEVHRAQRDHCAPPGSPLNTTSCLCQLKCQHFAEAMCYSVGAQTAWVHLSGSGRVWGDFSHILSHSWHVPWHCFSECGCSFLFLPLQMLKW